MNSVFKPFLCQFVLVFFDDILVYNHSWEENLSHLKSVFDTLRENSLMVNRSKCHFSQFSIAYLGYIISSKGLRVDPEKITAICCWSLPTLLKEVRGFLGLMVYYHCFVKGYARLASPLIELLKKESFIWTKSTSTIIFQLKEALSSVPVFSLLDFCKVFTM